LLDALGDEQMQKTKRYIYFYELNLMVNPLSATLSLSQRMNGKKILLGIIRALAREK